ncbi:unnamed protein product [Angiostrongylus costaricensis]|uniref:Cyclin N-terminal domain-containing protein n=1 Tax=Angiostrongylus costaricensis TaxID=334426 RepID=A0A0R3PZ32_ANGCS|nr:unnamed protein product [Angiostrongylus costaricensis]
MDYRSDWICELALENSGRIMSASECDNDYLTLESVQYIFTVCVRLRLPHDIRYLAVLIFARFMRIHSVQVFGFLSSLRLSEKRRLHEWEKVEANLSRQTTLRMLSSIQIASKALSYHDVSFWVSFLAATLGKMAVVELIFKTSVLLLAFTWVRLHTASSFEVRTAYPEDLKFPFTHFSAPVFGNSSEVCWMFLARCRLQVHLGAYFIVPGCGFLASRSGMFPFSSSVLQNA